MLKNFKIIWWSCLVFLIFTLGTATAQDPPAANLRNEFARLERLLAAAREIFSAAPHQQARDLIAKAESLRKEAEEKFNARRFREALVIVREAIALAEKALSLAFDTPLLEPLRDRLAELLRRAENEVPESRNREAERLLQEARRNKFLGDQAFSARSFQAFEYYRLAISLAERALNLIAPRPGTPAAMRPAELLERARDYYFDLEAQAREALTTCSNQVAQRLVNQARKQEQSAEEAFRRGEYPLAQQLYSGAIRLLLRAMDFCPQQALTGERLRNDLALLWENLRAAEEKFPAGSDPRAQALLDWARKLAQEAEAAINAQQFHRARRRLERSRNLVERAMRNQFAAPDDIQRLCETRLQQLQSDLAEVETQATANPEVKKLVELARNAHAEAQRLCTRPQTSRHPIAAFTMMIRMGHQFLLQAESLSQETGASQPDREALQQRLQELAGTLAEVRSNLDAGDAGFAGTLVEQATAMQNRAQAAFQVNQFHVANETSAIAFELLREALKLAK